MEKIESFKLDHNKVKAPYVRKCCVLDGEFGAQEYAKKALKEGFSLNIYGK